MGDKNNESYSLKDEHRENTKNKWEKINYPNGDAFYGELKDGKPFYGAMKYGSGVIFEGYFRNINPLRGKMLFSDGIILDGDFDEFGQLYSGKKIFKNGTVFDGKFDNGQFAKGNIICYDGKAVEYKGGNIQFSKDYGDCIFSGVFKDELDENGQPLDKVRI
ncbi:MAG: hypothetical protein LBP39_03365, partial [Rickettsiales bacterium]|nr:hypothetical protein [Rickettsiales bacterium]